MTRLGILSVPYVVLLVTLLLVTACDTDDVSPTSQELHTSISVRSPAEPSKEVAESVASTATILRDHLPVVEFVRSNEITVRLPVEVPPRSEYVIGLSGRKTLDERGMLFHYPSPDSHVSFWMKNTYFDLSIAFISSELRVVEIRSMNAKSLEIIRPLASHQYAIEVSEGWYSKHGIVVGDRVRFLFELPTSDEDHN